jgi:putative membrane protein
MRTVYLGVLATHVLLSTTVVPLALTAFWFALRREFRRHRK